MAKYKPGDYIILTGSCDTKFIAKSVKVNSIVSNYYFLDMMDDSIHYYLPWKIDVADVNSYIDSSRTILYGKN